VARGGRSPRSLWPGVLKDEMGTHTSLARVYAYSLVGEREDYERLCETSQAMIYADVSRLMLRRLTRA
jgi:hypothetical protein